MDTHNALDVAIHGTELALAAAAFISIIVTQIITTRLNSAKIQALSDHVEKQNGSLAEQSREMHAMQIVCARTHGIAPVRVKPAMPPNGDEP